MGNFHIRSGHRRIGSNGKSGQTTLIALELEIKGMSEDAQFFEFHHNFYNEKSEKFARCEMMGAWMDLKTRRLTGLTNDFLTSFSSVEKAEGFQVLTKEDIRRFAKEPKNLT